MDKKKLILIITPTFNEEELIFTVKTIKNFFKK